MTPEAHKELLLEQAKEWSFPPSDWERDLVDALLKGEVHTIRRAKLELMRDWGFETNECHENARSFAKRDIFGKTKVVTGWWIHDNALVLHSVVEIDGMMICITPSPLEENAIHFIPDREVVWKKTGVDEVPEREGHILGVGLRIFPEATIRQWAMIVERLDAGMQPEEALLLSPEQVEELAKIGCRRPV